MTLLSALVSFQTKCFLGPAHAWEPILITPPQGWLGSGPTNQNLFICKLSSHFPTGPAVRLCKCYKVKQFSLFNGPGLQSVLQPLQILEIYLNYQTCKDKIAHESKVLSFSKWALESRIRYPRASLCFDFWLLTQPKNEEKYKTISMSGAQ